MDSLESLLEGYRHRIEQCLRQRLPATTTLPGHLHEAMRYSSLDGGKRIRPALLYSVGDALGVSLEQLDGPACAVECIHAYSLVHDDLPAMDDDVLRRSKPTCHVRYDEATAILVGDALHSLAFELLASDPAMAVSSQQRLRMITELARACGSQGMVGGQFLDMEGTGRSLSLAELEIMHRYKTGALIRASVLLGAFSCPHVSDEQLVHLGHYADAVGLAFQIRDDILNVEADSTTLGKPQGSDADATKSTYTALLGLEGAKERARALHEEAMLCLSSLGAVVEPLRWLSAYIVNRDR